MYFNHDDTGPLAGWGCHGTWVPSQSYLVLPGQNMPCHLSSQHQADSLSNRRGGEEKLTFLFCYMCVQRGQQARPPRTSVSNTETDLLLRASLSPSTSLLLSSLLRRCSPAEDGWTRLSDSWEPCPIHGDFRIDVSRECAH